MRLYIYIYIACILHSLPSFAQVKANISVTELTPAYRLISKGRVLSVKAVASLHSPQAPTIEGFLYKLGGESFYPAGDMQLVQRILRLEGLQWSHDSSRRQQLASLIISLYIGLNGQAVLNERFFLMRSEPDSVDLEAIERLKREYGLPLVQENSTGGWKIRAYTVIEREGPLSIFRYTVEGRQTPLTIDAVSCELVESTPPIIFLMPLPQ